MKIKKIRLLEYLLEHASHERMARCVRWGVGKTKPVAYCPMGRLDYSRRMVEENITAVFGRCRWGSEFMAGNLDSRSGMTLERHIEDLPTK